MNRRYLFRSTSRLLQSSAAEGIGYGPFSATVKPGPVHTTANGTLEENVHLEANRQLRSALANLAHPSTLETIPFQSKEWRHCMLHLYRTLFRLHNKPIAVSLSTSLEKGPAEAIADVTGLDAAAALRQASPSAKASSPEFTESKSSSSSPAEPTMRDCLLRFLLSDEQRALGNHFVITQFAAHMEVDSVTAINFYASWYQYVLQLASGVTQRELTDAERRLLTDEQKGRLEDFKEGVAAMRAASKENTMV